MLRCTLSFICDITEVIDERTFLFQSNRSSSNLALSDAFQFAGFEPAFALNISSNRPFSSSCLSPLQSESKWEVLVMIIGYALNMNAN